MATSYIAPRNPGISGSHFSGALSCGKAPHECCCVIICVEAAQFCRCSLLYIMSGVLDIIGASHQVNR